MRYGKNTQGMTLLEVNLALGILVFGVISVASLFPIGLKVSDNACRATDASLIASLAKAQVELLGSTGYFESIYPAWNLWNLNKNLGRDAVVLPTDLDRNRPTGKTMKCSGIKDKRLNWVKGCWASPKEAPYVFVLMTSGQAAGKIFPVADNTDEMKISDGPPPKYMATITVSTITYDLKDSGIHGGDSFRVIYNQGAVKCIPSDFLSDGRTIPTINGLNLNQVRESRSNPAFGLGDMRMKSMQTLEKDQLTKYTYAVVLDSAELGSPSLYRAFVLIFRNYDVKDDGITRYKPWDAAPPVEFYPFFYRRASLVQDTGDL